MLTESGTTSSFRSDTYGVSLNQNCVFWPVKLCSYTFSFLPTASLNLFLNTLWNAPES